MIRHIRYISSRTRPDKARGCTYASRLAGTLAGPQGLTSSLRLNLSRIIITKSRCASYGENMGSVKIHKGVDVCSTQGYEHNMKKD